MMFRGLGGIADNIVQDDGPFGRGIFAVDPTRAVRLHVPRNLLIPVSEIEFAGGVMKIKPDADIGEPERVFIENYYEAFSWGGEGRLAALKHIEALDNLPADMRALLSKRFSLSSLFEQGSASERAERWFLANRMINLNGKDFLMPVMELLNHSPNGATYSQTDGLAIEGQFSGEVLAQYNDAIDPLGMFHSYGFASSGGICFSLPIKDDRRGIVIERSLNRSSKIGSVSVPNYELESGTVKFSCVMTGNAKFPRLSKGIFCHVMKEAGKAKPDEIFDALLHDNRIKFLELLEKLELHEGGLVPTLRKMVRCQLEAMSHCVGTREV